MLPGSRSDKTARVVDDRTVNLMPGTAVTVEVGSPQETSISAADGAVIITSRTIGA
jgi:hypothetical protein